MGTLEHGIFALLNKLVRTSPGPAPSFIPSPDVPAGLTLQSTITTSSTPTTTSWPEWVYVVAVGGGGGGGLGAGGGGGACFQGWMKKSEIGAVTIGAGGAANVGSNPAGQGGATLVGSLRVPGGGSGSPASTTNGNHLLAALDVEPGAGQGGMDPTSSSTPVQAAWALFGRDNTAFGMFVGGRAFSSATYGVQGRATSGAGSWLSLPGGAGVQGPGGGGTGSSPNAGGASASPNGTTYTGGAPTTGAGGGGAGILANGSAGTTAAGGTGGAGGSGGGGGGGGAGVGGAGGNGAVLIYF